MACSSAGTFGFDDQCCALTSRADVTSQDRTGHALGPDLAFNEAVDAGAKDSSPTNDAADLDSSGSIGRAPLQLLRLGHVDVDVENPTGPGGGPGGPGGPTTGDPCATAESLLLSLKLMEDRLIHLMYDCFRDPDCTVETMRGLQDALDTVRDQIEEAERAVAELC